MVIERVNEIPKYDLYTISSKMEIVNCPTFEVSHFLWNSKQQPKTVGRMGYLEGKGIFVQMTCYESDPKRTFYKHSDPVYQDSAMEAFFAFPNQQLQDVGAPAGKSVLYFNFEFNANGAMLAQYGLERNSRTFLTDEQYALTEVKAKVEEDCWRIELIVPDQLLKQVADISSIPAGAVFYCNFYKISESKDIEHYGAYSEILSETPDFHLPQYFAKVIKK